MMSSESLHEVHIMLAWRLPEVYIILIWYSHDVYMMFISYLHDFYKKNFIKYLHDSDLILHDWYIMFNDAKKMLTWP